VHVDSAWVGTRVAEMQRRIKAPIPFLSRFGQGLVPDETTLFQDGDLLYAGVANDDESRVEAILGQPPAQH